MRAFISPDFACIAHCIGVHHRCELCELRKETYDSTGLRAKHLLNTPRTRCASSAKLALVRTGSADDTAQNVKTGRRKAPRFAWLKCFLRRPKKRRRICRLLSLRMAL
jgi:hypothetical protein